MAKAKRNTWERKAELRKQLAASLSAKADTYRLTQDLYDALADATIAALRLYVSKHPNVTRDQLELLLQIEDFDSFEAKDLVDRLLLSASGPLGGIIAAPEPAPKAKKPAATRAKKSSTTKAKKPAATRAKKSSTTKAKKPAATRAKKSSTTKAKKPAATRAKKSSTTKAKKPAAKKAASMFDHVPPVLNAFDRRVAARLTSGDCAVVTIAGALGSTARKVGNSLSKLRDAGIAEQQGANWRKVPTSDDRPVEPADVLAHLRQHGPRSVGDLADALGVTHSGSVANALTKLERTNQVRRTLTPDGGLRWAAQVELIKDDPPPKARDGGRRPLADRVVELLDAKGRLTTAAIRSELGCAGSRLNSALTKLEDQGRVAMSGADGWVRVPEAAE